MDETLVPSWENRDHRKTGVTQKLGEALSLQSARSQQLGELGARLQRKRTPVFTGTQTSQQMNQGCTHTKMHLHAHKLSICACEAALLALKTQDKVTAQQCHSTAAAQMRLCSPTMGFSTVSAPSPPAQIARDGHFCLQSPVLAGASAGRSLLSPNTHFQMPTRPLRAQLELTRQFNHPPKVLVRTYKSSGCNIQIGPWINTWANRSQWVLKLKLGDKFTKIGSAI